MHRARFVNTGMVHLARGENLKKHESNFQLVEVFCSDFPNFLISSIGKARGSRGSKSSNVPGVIITRFGIQMALRYRMSFQKDKMLIKSGENLA